ncbi:hypothetical protein ES708_17394 [subsurface metagenome]
MKYNTLAIVGLLVVCVLIVLFRINWIKGIPSMSNDKVLEGIASRIVLDFVLVGIFIWYLVSLQTPLDFNPIYIRTIFMAALVITFFVVWAILRIKYKRPKSPHHAKLQSDGPLPGSIQSRETTDGVD